VEVAALTALGAHGLRITGTGTIDGRSREFMTGFDAENEWWRPGPFRPRLFVLTGCKDLELQDVLLRQAPSWTVHLVGCEHVLIDRVRIDNQLDVPNCDGIDPDHCRDVEIRGCHIVCGDDGVVVKTSRQGAAYGPCANIVVKDCEIETQDAGVKIGTETTQDIHDIRFERCKIRSISATSNSGPATTRLHGGAGARPSRSPPSRAHRRARSVRSTMCASATSPAAPKTACA
jgi:polygalacturonase